MRDARSLRGERGQTATEYLLVISVLVVAIVGVTYLPMRNAIEGGTEGFQNKMEGAAQNGQFGQGNEER